jgi:SsrA-binding protein
MGIKIIAQNKQAHFNYLLSDRFEVGLVLQGTEVKSLRENQCSLTESYILIDQKFEVWIIGMSIIPYKFGTYDNHQADRRRKLLLNKSEIINIHKAMATKGLTLVPVKIYFKDSRVKMEIALAKGKKLHDKRAAEQEKSIAKKLRQGDYD